MSSVFWLLFSLYWPAHIGAGIALYRRDRAERRLTGRLRSYMLRGFWPRTAPPWPAPPPPVTAAPQPPQDAWSWHNQQASPPQPQPPQQQDPYWLN